MNFFLRKFGKTYLNASTKTFKIHLLNFNIKQISFSNNTSFGAKKVVSSTAAGGNKVANVSSNSTSQVNKGFPAKKTTTDSIKVNLNNLGRVSLDTPLDNTTYTNNPEGVYEDYIKKKSSQKTQEIINSEREYLCNNYAPLPVVCAKGKGVYVEDVDGKVYIDFLAAYSALNHGHGNDHIIEAAYEQMKKLHMTSRAFYNNILATAGELVCKLFQFEKVLFMNSGVEAGESAVKIARRWGYVEKKIPNDQAKIVFAKGNFWGRSLYACGSSDDPSRYEKFGPFDQSSHYLVQYGNLSELQALLEKDDTICAVFLEPIQGEGGVIIPPPGYLVEVSNLCKKHNVLMIVDEIQTGIGRTGYLLCCNMESVHPDIILLGKSLSGGLYPVSAVLSSKKIMDTIKPGEHGSTYGGNPLAAQICISALQELIREPIIKNSFYRGIEFGLILREELENSRFIKEVRGRGLMYAIELWPECGCSAYDFSLWLMERGLLCKPTKKYTLRLSPPLVITPEEINKSAEIISTVFKMAEQLNPDFTPSEAARFNTPSLGEGDIQFIQARRMEKLRKQNEFLSNSQSTFANNLTQNNAPSNQSQKTKQTEKEIQNTDDGSTIV